MKDKTSALQAVPNPKPVPSGKMLEPLQDEATALISQAINKGVDVATMEKLLAMRRELKAEKAKEEFDRAMAAFQADCPTIKKTKEVKTNSGALAYKYAPIDSIVDQVKKSLKKHGFSYSSNMELSEDLVKVSIKVTHAGGHSETTVMTVPLGTKTQIMSQTQVVAAAQTFAKRYAFCNAFGILTGDEDDDANSIPKTSPVKAVANRASFPISYDDQKEVTRICKKKGYDAAALQRYVKKAFNVEDYKLLTSAQAKQLIMKLNAIPEKKPAEIPAADTFVGSVGGSFKSADNVPGVPAVDEAEQLAEEVDAALN